MSRPMRDLVATGSPDDVSTRLAQAWDFLSARQRSFIHLQARTDLLKFTDFSFFMYLAIDDQPRSGGIGVLIDREDGLTVAAHMFGVPRSKVSEVDLYDACAEACNVLADCVAPDAAPGHLVRLGLPRQVTALEYASLVDNSRALAVYQGEQGGHSLFVVRAENLSQSPEEKS